MSRRKDVQGSMNCRESRKRFWSVANHGLEKAGRAAQELSELERMAFDRHIEGCKKCLREFRLYSLAQAALDAAASPEPVAPGKEFFAQLRAKIARGPAETAPPRASATSDESWVGVLSLTARQLIPVMALVLLMMIGATFIWSEPRVDTQSLALRPSERVLFNDIYDYPQPTSDDVLETLVAVEDK